MKENITIKVFFLAGFAGWVGSAPSVGQSWGTPWAPTANTL
jgi:hypothetical protein